MDTPLSAATAPAAKAPRSSHRVACGLCTANCGLVVTVQDDRITAVRGDRDHPVSRGYVCPKGAALGEIQNAPDRVAAPLRRNDDGGWVELTWDAALDEISGRLTSLREKYGPQAVAFHVGRAGIGKEFIGYAERFAHVFGSPNFSSCGSQCKWAYEMANHITYGKLAIPDLANSRCMLFWGDNPEQSMPVRKRLIAQARERGAAMIVVDPSRTRLAAGADFHLRVRPGTDAALALGFLHVVIAEGLYDREFVDAWTVGFDALAARAAEYPPERVADATGVGAEELVAAARTYGAGGPACIAMGNGIELHRDGVQAARALACLQSVCGNLDIPGGGLLTLKNGLTPVVPPVEPPAGGAPTAAIGAVEFPFFHELRGQAQANLLARAILDGEPYPVRGLVIGGSNPLVQWPGVERLREALASLDLLVVMDTSFTETTRAAHLVLPATLPVERDELWDTILVGGEPRLGLSPAAVRRAGARDDWYFWAELARRTGHAAAFPWATGREALDWRLAPLGLDAARLEARGAEGVIYAERTSRAYTRAGFKTPSGKVELFSATMAARGYDPVPGPAAGRAPGSVADGPEPRPSGGAPAVEFPLVLTSGARTVGYTHSRYRRVPMLRRLQPEPLLDVHPETAAEAGLADGETGLLVSAHGSLRVPVRFVDDLAPGVLRMPHGWEEANVNRLSGSRLEDLDPVSGFPVFRSLPVRLETAG